MKFILRSISRNLLILAISAALVLATQMARNAVFAGDGEDQGGAQAPDRYVALLTANKDFDGFCTGFRLPRIPIIAPLADKLSDPTDRVIEKYHEEINCLFNSRIKILVEKMLKGQHTFTSDTPLSPEDFADILAALTPPQLKFDDEGQAVGREPCKGIKGEPPLSTYCIAMSAVDEYAAFRRAMVRAREMAKYDVTQQWKTESELKSVNDANVNLRAYGEKINKIDREIEVSRQALDQTLATYNELQMSLPLHRKYKDVIKALEEYRNTISKIRMEVDLYPFTFLDVTTTECT